MPKSLLQTLWESFPAIYREGGVGGFFWKFLRVFARDLEAIETDVLRIHKLLNPDETDEKFLPWLASWVALTLDQNWSVSKRRQLIRRAVDLYKIRGTPAGIAEFVRIYTGYLPTIIEHFKAGWQVGVTSTVGVDTKVYGSHDDNAHRFHVIVYTTDLFDADAKERIRQVVLKEKPSHTELIGIVWFDNQFWRVGVQSTVGVDTRVGG